MEERFAPPSVPLHHSRRAVAQHRTRAPCRRAENVLLSLAPRGANPDILMPPAARSSLAPWPPVSDATSVHPSPPPSPPTSLFPSLTLCPALARASRKQVRDRAARCPGPSSRTRPSVLAAGSHGGPPRRATVPLARHPGFEERRSASAGEQATTGVPRPQPPVVSLERRRETGSRRPAGLTRRASQTPRAPTTRSLRDKEGTRGPTAHRNHALRQKREGVGS